MKSIIVSEKAEGKKTDEDGYEGQKILDASLYISFVIIALCVMAFLYLAAELASTLGS